jgi:hypothetical protein
MQVHNAVPKDVAEAPQVVAAPTSPPSSKGAYTIAVAGGLLLVLLVATNMNC